MERTGLEVSEDELMRMFDLTEARLGVHILYNSPERLNAVFVKRMCPENREGWKALKKWSEKRELGWENTEIPDDMMPEIYRFNAEHVAAGEISEMDKMILSVSMRIENDQSIYLSHIVRNPSEKYKGLAASFYRNMDELIADRGFRFSFLWPYGNEPKLQKYWQNFGYVSGELVDPSKAESIGETFDETTMVRFFRPEDMDHFLIH